MLIGHDLGDPGRLRCQIPHFTSHSGHVLLKDPSGTLRTRIHQIINFLEGSGNIEDAMHAWAKEFASAGVEKGKKSAEDE